MSAGLNTKFNRKPLNFTAQHLLLIPKADQNLRRTVAHDYNITPCWTKRALDISQGTPKALPIVTFGPYENTHDTGLLRRSAHSTPISAYWAPLNTYDMPIVILGEGARFFLTPELSGCTLAISSTNPTIIVHIPPEKRLDMINRILPNRYPNSYFCYLTPELHYSVNQNARTTLVGIRNRFRQSWRFYMQTYIPTQFAGIQYAGYAEQGYDFVRITRNIEFPLFNNGFF